MTNLQELKKQVENILFGINCKNTATFDPSTDEYLEPNYTVNCFFYPDDLKNVQLMIERLKRKDSNHFFYKPSQFHITLLGMIDLNSDKNQIIKNVQIFLDKYKLIFHLLGVGSSTKAASVTAYPINFSLEALRTSLRKIGGGKLLYGPYEKLAWINFMRYQSKPKDELLSALWKESDTDFGIIRPKQIKLLKNSSILLNNAEIVHNFDI